MSLEPYDFREPGRLAGDLEQRLGRWLRACCVLAPTRWAKHLPFPVEMNYRKDETARASDALARLPESVVGFRLLLNAGTMNTLLILPRPLTLALLASMLGDAASELPPDRELTVVEDSLCDYLLQNLWVAPFEETWPGVEPLNLRLGQKEPSVRWTRMFPADEYLVVSSFAVRGPFGEQEWYWLLPRKGLMELLERLGGWGLEPGQQAVVRPRLETLVQEIPVEVTVTLGAVDLPISQLADLKPGDVVLLGQRVSEVLMASVAGQKRFRVWPGRVGSQQAVQIESLLEC